MERLPLSPPHACKLRGHYKWEDDGCLCINLDAVAIQFDLAPADSLVWPRSRIAAVKLLRSIDVHSALCTIAHEIGVCDVVLDDAAAKNNHAGPLSPYCNGVDFADILNNVDAQLLWRRLEGVKVQHVAKTAIRQGWTEDRDVVLPRPVVDRPLIVDLSAQTVNHLAGCPVQRLLRLFARLLLLEHLV